MEDDCSDYDPDQIFRNFKLLEFPATFVGLSRSLELDVEVNLNTSAYLKTTYEGRLVKFEEARLVSAPHRAFSISQIDDSNVKITFTPTSECISKAKKNKQFGNRFVFDLRLIKIYGSRCCLEELHSEIGRFYISGQFEYCNITHNPSILQFGDVFINDLVNKHLCIRNESESIPAKIEFIRKNGFLITPEKLTIQPNSTKKICISVKPTSFNISKTIECKIKNAHALFQSDKDNDEVENVLPYNIAVSVKVLYSKVPKGLHVESLHKLYEQNKDYTFMDEEIPVQIDRKNHATKLFEISKLCRIKKESQNKLLCTSGKCYSETSDHNKKPSRDFCKTNRQYIDTYELFNVKILPLLVDFGRVGLSTYGEDEISIVNPTTFSFTIKLLNDECVLYTNAKNKTHTLKITPHSDTKVKIFCLGFVEGTYRGTFEYAVDNKYYRKHPYALHVGNPTLLIMEKSLKFGMVTNESFITSQPIRIQNFFNVAVKFTWEDSPDAPFEISPKTGYVPQHGCKICDITYLIKHTKSKTHEVDCISESKTTKYIPIELNIVTRKISIKFLQPAILFKEIPLNLEVKEIVKLENTSREMALFNVVEPLIPGLIMEPMVGVIGPKMVITFEITVKFCCILEFSFEIYVKINNKENVILPVSGTVVEPKISFHPKTIYMPRIPCKMISYVPVVIQNVTTTKCYLDFNTLGPTNMCDEKMFDIFIAQGNDKQKISALTLEAGHSKTVFAKVYDEYRREYDTYLPFRINQLLGPPNEYPKTTELQYYIGEHEKQYENNSRVKVKATNKDISYCRITGVITAPWIEFSVDNFEIEYFHNGLNLIEFKIKNISKYFLPVTIQTSKLAPNFTLNLCTEDGQSIINESTMKFELDQEQEVTLTVKFHPKGHGRFISTAVMYLDRGLSIPYSNLTFIGKRQVPEMTSNVSRIICPPCLINTEIKHDLEIKLEAVRDLSAFSYTSKDDRNLRVHFMKTESDIYENFTILTVELTIRCDIPYTSYMNLCFHCDTGSSCDVEISFCFTACPLTLHTLRLVDISNNPYPYFPLQEQHELYGYMETCLGFLEKWMFQQGFRRDLYPIIPDTLHTISSSLTSLGGGTKSKGINVSYLNFIKRIAGPLMKYVRKVTVTGIDEPFKSVKEIHDNYKEIINLLRSRGSDLWGLRAMYLLSYDQFVIYSENVTPKTNAKILFIQTLLSDVNLFNRLNKQSWMDFILQTYKVFVIDSCFFECVCVSMQTRDIIIILTDWYNSICMAQHRTLRGNKRKPKVVKNLTTDLSDGIAIISAILNFCPFFKEQFSVYCDIEDDGFADNIGGNIVHNACLIIEAMNQLRLYFPISSQDFRKPNFIQMLFLSIHLYIVLPTFKPKDIVKLHPPLLKSSTRTVAINPTGQESLIFQFLILNNDKNSFIAEKIAPGENTKKIFLSVKYTANFVEGEKAILLIHGYNKTRIFDTYIIFILDGHISALTPHKKCKVTGTLYRPTRVDVLVTSPFLVPAEFTLSITDVEPSLPVDFSQYKAPRFYLRRLNLMDDQISLNAAPKESGAGQDVVYQKVHLQLTCLSTQVGNSWIWFRGEIGEFFVKVTTQPRWDLAVDTLEATLHHWPIDPCSCGEACECYRTTILIVPHKNELMVKSLRSSLQEYASDIMIQVFDRLIEATTGRLILGMLLAEGGTNMSEVSHILRDEISYRVTSRNMLPRLERVTLSHHCDRSMLTLPVTLPPNDKSEKYTVTLTSDCLMDIRTYKVNFVAEYVPEDG